MPVLTCFICRRRDQNDLALSLCAPCEARAWMHIHRLLRDGGFVVILTCSWGECRAEFPSKRMRTPAYCRRACQAKAYRDRKTRGGEQTAAPAARPPIPTRRPDGLCALCVRNHAVSNRPECKACLVRVLRYVRTYPAKLHLVIELSCAYEPCGIAFTASRWRKPAYCSDSHKQAAYRSRQKEGQLDVHAHRKPGMAGHVALQQDKSDRHAYAVA